MGLHLCYELSLPAGAREAEAVTLVRALHAFARTRAFDDVSPVVRLAGAELVHLRTLGRPTWGALSSAQHARKALYLRALGVDEGDTGAYLATEVPAGVAAAAVGFGVLPGRGAESASFGLARLTGTPEHRALGWHWHEATKPQYASRYGEEHLLRVHGGLLDVLEAAERLGFGVVIRDEFGYWPERDVEVLRRSLDGMNRFVAGFAGRLADAVRDAGGDSRAVQAPIFAHPDFERLETEARGEDA